MLLGSSFADFLGDLFRRSFKPCVDPLTSEKPSLMKLAGLCFTSVLFLPFLRQSSMTTAFLHFTIYVSCRPSGGRRGGRRGGKATVSRDFTIERVRGAGRLNFERKVRSVNNSEPHQLLLRNECLSVSVMESLQVNANAK